MTTNKYHTNNKGEVKPCRAEVRSCPYKDNPHFDLAPTNPPIMWVISDNPKVILPPAIEKFMEELESLGIETYLVGGFMRDTLLQRNPDDIDLASPKHPEEMISLLRDYHVIPTGIQHGTITVLVQGNPVEITTFRGEGEYSDGRHPDNVWYLSDIKEDLSRRDFSINAISWRKKDGFIDPFNGREDLKNGIIRTVGSPEKRFQEDYLRMLRGLRFASQLGFDIEEKTALAIHENYHHLSQTATERKKAELDKLFMGRGASHVLKKFPEVVSFCVPSFYENMRGRPDSEFLYKQASKRVELSPPDPMIKLAAFIYDLPKLNPSFNIQTLKDELRLSNKEYEQLSCYFEFQNNPPFGLKNTWKRVREIGEESFQQSLSLAIINELAQPHQNASSLKKLNQISVDFHNLKSQNKVLNSKDLAINGDDLKEIGITGKGISKTFEYLLELVCLGNTKNEKDVLLSLAKKRKG